MITGRQIRAARALLDISQAELASAAGLTKQGISKIEDGSVQPREGTLADIQRVFVDKQLEFMENEGVRFRSEDVAVMNGQEGLGRFFDLVFSFVQVSGGVLRQAGIAEERFDQCAEERTTFHRHRMARLVNSRKDIFVQAILNEGDTDFVCTDYADYRWYPRNMPPMVPYYIFGDSVGLFSFGAQNPPKIVLISSFVMAQAFRSQFDEMWAQAKQVS
ncbi:MAG: helix-turn-helix transcriptional regulator [Alphaproteobacteria bacterium]|nr:helix-turn-helix transcriptional regulator [Alphaproteobacteria bacterium]